jgi:hypothetical protein
MTTGDPRYFAAVPIVGPDVDEDDSDRETVGASDAEADAVRAGLPDRELTHPQRDSDGVPVGAADAEADRERAGGDPE